MPSGEPRPICMLLSQRLPKERLCVAGLSACLCFESLGRKIKMDRKIECRPPVAQVPLSTIQ